MSINALEASIPANNEKIIEIYRKVKSLELNVSPEFQRKLVWKKQHKVNFIDTILLNFPFPEIYKAPGELNVDTLELTDIIVDGQQRVSTIVDFIDSTGVFALDGIPIKFTNLSKEEKTNFLNYEVSVRYLKNANKEQIKDIFQRINNTEYGLNATERLNAQWGDSEFIHFCKQLIEKDYVFDEGLFTYVMEPSSRAALNNFFENNNIFTDNDNSRMLSLQWTLSLIATILEEKYFRRYEKIQSYIEKYNDSFPMGEEVICQLEATIAFITSLNLNQKSYWFNKSNIFSLIVELYAYELSAIDINKFTTCLQYLEEVYQQFSKLSAEDDKSDIDPKLQEYFIHARNSVNDSPARIYRGGIIKDYIEESLLTNT
ncbi:MAG: DUF262 domain-containing protein [Sulfurimonas sp.]|jgi:hypothetical protein